MPGTVPVTIRVADLPEVKAAMAEAVAAAVAAERRRFVTLARATCACQRCKDDIAGLLKDKIAATGTEGAALWG
jgi:hypothetical protein